MVFLENNFDGFITLMKNMKYFFLSFLLVSFYGLKAQTFDSNFFKKEYQYYLSTPVFLPQRAFNDFTQSSLYFNTEKGSRFVGQQETASTDFGVFSQGIYTLPSVIFFGKMDIHRQYQKDKKWNLSPNEVQDNGIMPSPHYYAVSRPSAWNNQRYALLGGIVLPLLKEKWYFSLSADYILQEKYRTEYDPRPDVNIYRLVLSGATAIKIHPSHQLSIGGKYGTSRQNVAIKYDDNHTNIPFNYEKYKRWQLGYGVLQNPNSNSKRYKILQKGISLGYYFTKPRLKMGFNTEVMSVEENLYRSTDLDQEYEDLIGTLHQKQYKVLWHLSKSSLNDQKWLFYADATHFEAYNFLSYQGGKSYATDQTAFNIGAHWHQNTPNPLELALKVSYENAYQKDAISTTTTHYTSFSGNIYASKTYPIALWKVIPFIDVVYRGASHELKTQNTILSRSILESDYASKALKLLYDEVLLYDHSMLNKTQYYFGFGVNFKKELPRGVSLILGVSSQYRTTFVGNDRYGISSNINIYY